MPWFWDGAGFGMLVGCEDAVLPLVHRSAAAAQVSEEVLLALVLAESDGNPKAERWGEQTADAVRLMAAGDFERLSGVFLDVWPDISFGLEQQSMDTHPWWDGEKSLESALRLRTAVLTYPGASLYYGALRLRRMLRAVGGDPLAACVWWNSGGDNLAEPWYRDNEAESLCRYIRDLYDVGVALEGVGINHGLRDGLRKSLISFGLTGGWLRAQGLEAVADYVGAFVLG